MVKGMEAIELNHKFLQVISKKTLTKLSFHGDARKHELTPF